MRFPSNLTIIFSGIATRIADTTVNMTVVELNSFVFIFLKVNSFVFEKTPLTY